MAMKKTYKKRVARKGARKSMRKPAPGLARAVRAIAKVETLRQQETKYICSFSSTSTPPAPSQRVWNQLITQVVAGGYNYLQPVIPPIQQGINSSNVLGQKITLVNGYSKFHFAFTPDAAPYSQDIILKLFLLHSKQVKSLQAAASTGALVGGDLLRSGAGTQLDFNPYTAITDPIQLAMLPLNTLAWSGKCITMRLTKNTGMTSYDATTPTVQGDVPNLSAKTNYVDHTWNWTDAKNRELKYDNFVPGSPTNYCPLWGVVAYYPDGTPVSADAAVQLPIRITFSHHMWYKD